MGTYAIFLNQPSQHAWDAIRMKWPDRHFILDDRLAFIAPEGIILTSDIAGIVGVKSEEGVPQGLLGVVVEFSSYSGFNRSDLWEWLSKVQT